VPGRRGMPGVRIPAAADDPCCVDGPPAGAPFACHPPVARADSRSAGCVWAAAHRCPEAAGTAAPPPQLFLLLLLVVVKMLILLLLPLLLSLFLLLFLLLLLSLMSPQSMLLALPLLAPVGGVAAIVRRIAPTTRPAVCACRAPSGPTGAG
jgi:hypothetical protein